MFHYDEWPSTGDDVVLLYHGANNIQYGGLWFHLDRGLCCWADLEDPCGRPYLAGSRWSSHCAGIWTNGLAARGGLCPSLDISRTRRVVM